MIHFYFKEGKNWKKKIPGLGFSPNFHTLMKSEIDCKKKRHLMFTRVYSTTTQFCKITTN